MLFRSPLYLQFSKKVTYSHHPGWYYDIEYQKEQTRGYEYKEDLYCPGSFEMKINKGESILFSAGLSDIENRRLKPLFDREFEHRIARDSFINCLENAASQFFVHHDDKVDLIAGYHWFAVHGRDTFVALPGLTLPRKKNKLFLKVIDTLIHRMEGIFFPITITEQNSRYHSVDTQLWFFWALQQYTGFAGGKEMIWERYGKLMKSILEGYRNGTSWNIHMLENGLLYAGFENDTLTWMNARIDNKPVIDRNGLAVEINALWYNAIRYYIELARENKYNYGIKSWEDISHKIEYSFRDTFWIESSGYFADVVRGNHKDVAVRPNQLFVASLPYSPVDDDFKYRMLNVVKQELLTPRGIRTLSPKNPDYRGIYKGNIIQRDTTYEKRIDFH